MADESDENRILPGVDWRAMSARYRGPWRNREVDPDTLGGRSSIGETSPHNALPSTPASSDAAPPHDPFRRAAQPKLRPEPITPPPEPDNKSLKKPRRAAGGPDPETIRRLIAAGVLEPGENL